MSTDSPFSTPAPAPTPDVEGFDVPMSRVNALMDRKANGETLTFEDGLVIAYAIAERLRERGEHYSLSEAVRVQVKRERAAAKRAARKAGS